MWSAGINSLRFEPEGNISGLISAEGEIVPLKSHIWPALAGGAVEKWLTQVNPEQS